MIESLAESPETVLVGLGTVLLGYLIKYREWTFLIAGYDTSTDVPKGVAANIVGNLAIRVGVATIAFGLVAAGRSVPEAVALAFAAIVLLGAGRTIYRLQTYQKTPT
ncbi:DUF3784 domain-containing protein [Natrinema longum]|uniref:DUF3784 domain-containing protein n=1 Tax=Natrinema longum TaxID=370324 RepID=A0A8A2UDV1_9EURY|nr:DUF3784 domain-containing protein [Natrinema longum]MBZ6495987.1 DUF3784 domain-containing protein [Natrinema longum]QSW86078.1 DUF3784 domain-containing protein [Natrinema longum]